MRSESRPSIWRRRSSIGRWIGLIGSREDLRCLNALSPIFPLIVERVDCIHKTGRSGKWGYQAHRSTEALTSRSP